MKSCIFGQQYKQVGFTDSKNYKFFGKNEMLKMRTQEETARRHPSQVATSKKIFP